MSERNRTDPEYVMGCSAQETERLQKQSLLYNPSTRRLFEEAGITVGMKVLDVGSGAGDVALIAADLVGPSGTVIGVDPNPSILETARRRVRAAGLSNVWFIAEDIRNAKLDHDFDAVVGRLVLVYLGEPEAVLRLLSGHLRGRGASWRFRISTGPTARPPCPPLGIWHRCGSGSRKCFVEPGLRRKWALNCTESFLLAGCQPRRCISMRR
jgi:SAM-dependent methyltransferase